MKDVASDDLMVGLEPGQRVEARYPSKVTLSGTGISWTVTGSALAVSYGRHDLVAWCDYPGAVCIWNIFSRGFDETNPDFVLDHSCCIMSVKCHPTNPALVAGGSFNGEIIVWDLVTPEQPLAISEINDFGHKEPVTDLNWVFDTNLSEYLLISTGADGKILTWSLRNKLIRPLRGVLTSKGNSSRRSSAAYPGVTCLAVPSMSQGVAGRTQYVMAGLEGGTFIRAQAAKLFSSAILKDDVFKSSIANSDEIYQSLRSETDKFMYEKHIGAVTSLELSPFNRNVFLSAGQDGFVKLFHTLERAPIQEWEPVTPSNITGIPDTVCPLSAARFSPTRPMVFGVASMDGLLHIFDLVISSSVPVATLQIPTDSKSIESDFNKSKDIRKPSIMDIAFNKKQRDLLAAVDAMGEVHIWRLSWKLSNRQVGEEELFSGFVSKGSNSDTSRNSDGRALFEPE